MACSSLVEKVVKHGHEPLTCAAVAVNLKYGRNWVWDMNYAYSYQVDKLQHAIVHYWYFLSVVGTHIHRHLK